jgi:hypothetical protein
MQRQLNAIVFPNRSTKRFVMISFSLFPLVKVLVSILVVVLLSVIAERAGPRIAGIASGYPLGAAISLFFIGIEIDPAFAARSAIFTAAGLVATVAFVGGYLLGLRAAEGRRRMPALLLALMPALAAYGLAAWGVSAIPINGITAPLMALTSMVVANRVFRSIPDADIHEKIKLGLGVTLLRAVFAALVILVITTAAGLVGPEWAGLFSAFPITMLPLLVIIQFTYRPAHVRTIIKNVPRGLGSLLAYALVVAATYTAFGIVRGTVLGYLTATLYLVLLEYGRNRPRPETKPKVPSAR